MVCCLKNGAGGGVGAGDGLVGKCDGVGGVRF